MTCPAVTNDCNPLTDADANSHSADAYRVKVLFLIDDFSGPEGGTEQHLLFLQRELPADRLDLRFGVLTGIGRMRAEDFPIRPVMLGEGTPRGPRGAPARLRQLAAFVRETETDVIHAFQPTSEHYAILAARLARQGKVLGVRRNIGYWHTRRSLWTARAFARLGAHYAANCEAARQFAARAEWISQRRITVIRNPVCSKRLQEGLSNVPSRESLGIVDGEQVVGMVATVRPVKDYATFLRAARLVLDQRPQTRFLAIGSEEPAYGAAMRRLAEELGIARQVNWLGPMQNPICVLPLMDVAVLSSQSEAFSNSVLEYAAAGVPTVATDVGGVSEIVDDGQTGFLVSPHSPEAMASRIMQLLVDVPMRQSCGEAASRKMKDLFSQESVLRDHVELYARLADRRMPRLA